MSGAGAVPALAVRDLDRAVGYYRDVLGFSVLGAPGRDTALLSGYGATLRLRGPDGDDPCPAGQPAATLRVPDPRWLRHRLDDRGAHLMPADDLGAQWAGFFGVADYDGNVLAIGPAAGPRAALRRALAAPLDDLGHGRHERRRAREEQAHVAGFRAFYERLTNPRDVFYLFFSGRLLQWVMKAASYVPPDVNLVLLGSDLPADELAWLTAHAHRPFHHVPLRLDDQVAWQFLFEVNRHNFGWLDSDCLVLEPSLFAELARIDPGDALNCVWSWDGGYGFPLANTFLLFVNADVIGRLRAAGLDPSPYSYDYEWQNLQVPGRRCYSRRPSRTQRRAVAGLVPDDPRGRPATPQGMRYFDTMVMYQLIARSRGFGVRRVRELEGFGHIRGLPIQDQSSDELLHVGGASKADALLEYSKFFHDTGMRVSYLVAEYLMLSELPADVPDYYRDRLERVRSALDRHGLNPRAAVDAIRAQLVGMRGMSEQAADAVLGPNAELPRR